MTEWWRTRQREKKGRSRVGGGKKAKSKRREDRQGKTSRLDVYLCFNDFLNQHIQNISRRVLIRLSEINLPAVNTGNLKSIYPTSITERRKSTQLQGLSKKSNNGFTCKIIDASYKKCVCVHYTCLRPVFVSFPTLPAQSSNSLY